MYRELVHLFLEFRKVILTSVCRGQTVHLITCLGEEKGDVC